MEHHVTFHINDEGLRSVTDTHLASLWHIAQANPAPRDDRDAGALAEQIGREIIGRWLRWAGAPMWDRQGNTHYWAALIQHCLWDGTKWVRKDKQAMPHDAELKSTPGVSLGIEWWNSLGEQDRMHWMREAGDTGRVVDAWEAFKRHAATAGTEAT